MRTSISELDGDGSLIPKNILNEELTEARLSNFSKIRQFVAKYKYREIGGW